MGDLVCVECRRCYYCNQRHCSGKHPEVRGRCPHWRDLTPGQCGTCQRVAEVERARSEGREEGLREAGVKLRLVAAERRQREGEEHGRGDIEMAVLHARAANVIEGCADTVECLESRPPQGSQGSEEESDG